MKTNDNSLSWHLEVLPLSKLKAHEKNPRQISKDQMGHLEGLIDKFGMIDKPIVNLDFTIIGGHQRIKVLKRKKVKSVECWIPDRQLEQEEVDHLCIGLNLNRGDWDFDILANLWDPVDLLNWGFSSEQLLDCKIEDLGSTEEDEDVLEPCKDEDAITKLGDIYELGNHRLICGDSTMPDVVEKVLGGHEPVLMVTDPPYGVNYDPSWRKDIKDKHGVAAKALGKVQNDGQVNWALAWHLFPGSVAYVWHAGKFCSEVQKSLEEAEYEMINQIIWVKQHFALSRGDYHWQHEPCWYAVKKGQQHNWQGSRKEATVWEIANLNAFGQSKGEDERTAHSTQKPLECMAKPMRNNSQKGDHVYDPFLGSGTTLIAAEQIDRKCLGIELSPAYCDIIVRRWVKERQKKGKDATVKRNSEIIQEF